MATIKSFTDLEQSKKLAEILPIESADMYYFRQIDNDYFPPNVESICPIPLFKDGKEDFNYDIRCWSLAALLGILPDSIYDNTNEFSQLEFSKRSIAYRDLNDGIKIGSLKDNLVDACYELILKLHELKML